MPPQIENVVVISEEASISRLIESILSSFDKYKVENFNFKDFGNSLFLKKKDCFVIVDERMNVTAALTLNKDIREKYPSVKLVVLSSYPNGDFDSQFRDSGADHVIGIGELHLKLLQIFEPVNQ